MFAINKNGCPYPMNLTVPAGNISFSVQIRSQLAERAAYWRPQWTIEKDSKKKVFNNRTKKGIAPQPKWGFIRRTVDENFPSMKDVKNDDKIYQKLRSVVTRALDTYDSLQAAVSR